MLCIRGWSPTCREKGSEGKLPGRAFLGYQLGVAGHRWDVIEALSQGNNISDSVVKDHSGAVWRHNWGGARVKQGDFTFSETSFPICKLGVRLVIWKPSSQGHYEN